ncbi:hypothetical protein GC176_13490 [bacterium]|nr:hypothetical protein [bacterium]
MTFQQVKDIIALIRNGHQHMHECLELPRTGTSDGATSQLMQALCQDERELQIILTRIGADEDAAVLNTWLQYAPTDELTGALNGLWFDADLPIDEVVARKQRFDVAILQLYGQLESSCSVPRVQELFRTLREYTESRMQNQSWAVRDPQGFR